MARNITPVGTIDNGNTMVYKYSDNAITENDIRRIVREELERSKARTGSQFMPKPTSVWTLSPNDMIDVRTLTLGTFDGFIRTGDANLVKKDLLSGRTFIARWNDKEMCIKPHTVDVDERPDGMPMIYVWFDIV